MEAERLRARNNESPTLTEVTRQQWGIKRDQGQWVVQGLIKYPLDNSSRNNRNTVFEAPEIQLPTDLTGSSNLPMPWQDLQVTHPTAFDAVSSPSGEKWGLKKYFFPRQALLHVSETRTVVGSSACLPRGIRF